MQRRESEKLINENYYFKTIKKSQSLQSHAIFRAHMITPKEQLRKVMCIKRLRVIVQI